MAIVNYQYYTNTFFGETIAETDFGKYEARAQDAIFLLCRNRISEDDFDKLSADMQSAVKKAICAQCEYFSLYGLDVANTGLNNGGFTVGKVRVDKGSSNYSGARATISPLAISYLEQTGLLNPNVPYTELFIDYRNW